MVITLINNKKYKSGKITYIIIRQIILLVFKSAFCLNNYKYNSYM